MAYQNVGTPRFYINTLEWLASNGVITLPSDHFRTLPVITKPIGTWNTIMDIEDGAGMTIPSGIFNNKCFFAALGHTYHTNSVEMNVYVGNSAAEVDWGDTQINVDAPNTDGDATATPPYDGFSLATLTNQYFDIFAYNAAGECGSVIFGTYYDMPHSPDLNLTMTREYGGIKTIETKGGASLSNDFGSSPPNWGELAAWQIRDLNTMGEDKIYKLSKSGRRIWQLSFSFLADSSIFPLISSLDAYESTSADGEPFSAAYEDVEASTWQNDNTILDSDNFYSQVIHKTNGGQLPFIFQPDGGANGNNNPDQFAICKLSGFSFQQTAPNLYSVKMKIREVW